MFEANLINILYLAFRLAPFIIVCFFTLNSFMNWDIKGIVYLFGLLFACFLNMLIGNTGAFDSPSSSSSEQCNIMGLGESGTALSKLPLSTTVFSYTFFYLLMFIINLTSHESPNNPGAIVTDKKRLTQLNAAMTQNIPTLILFPTLLIVDSIWLSLNSCASGASIFTALIISGVVGILWATIITSTKNTDLQYVNNKGLDVCNRPTKTLYRCKPKAISS